MTTFDDDRPTPRPPTSEPTLWQQFGADHEARVANLKTALSRIYDQIMGRPNLAIKFDGIDRRRVEHLMFEHLGEAGQAPPDVVKYTGRPLDEAHAKVNTDPDPAKHITMGDAVEVVQIVTAVLTDMGLPPHTVQAVSDYLVSQAHLVVAKEQPAEASA